MMVAVENVRSRFNSALGLTSQGFKDRCEIPARTSMTERPRRRSTGTGGCCSRVAYQMLGSVADAEDVVQDTWLRWSAADRERRRRRARLPRADHHPAGAGPDGLGAGAAGELRRAVAAGAAADRRRTGGGGPAGPEPEDAAELGEQVSLALLVVLETLSPAERAVFVLREVFGMSVGGGGRRAGRTEAAVRQMAHRAREHVQARQPRFDTDRRAQREVTERFLAAVAGGDVESLLAALAPGVVLVSDGGGKVDGRAAADRRRRQGRPVPGRGRPRRAADLPGLRVEVAEVNGAPAVVGWTDDEPVHGVSSWSLVDGLVEQVLVVVNPDKLAGLGAGPSTALRLRRVTTPSARRQPAEHVERVLCVLAHPDDVDFGSAGTVADLDRGRHRGHLLHRHRRRRRRLRRDAARRRWARCAGPSSGPPRPRSASPTSGSSATPTAGWSSPSTCAATSAG